MVQLKMSDKSFPYIKEVVLDEKMVCLVFR